MKRHVPSMILLLCVVTGIARAEDWPTWRHDPSRSGVTSERLAPPLELVWSFKSRQAKQAPKPKHNPHNVRYPWVTWYSVPMSAAGDAVFFNSAADGRTVCLDAASGKTRWEFFAGAAVNRTPTVWEGKVYVGSDDGNVYCLDAKTGAIVWKFKAAPTNRMLVSYGKPVSVWPVRTDVAVDKGVAYFGAGIFPHDGTFMYAVDAKTGKLLWRDGTQCETAGRGSMAPAGHLCVFRKSIFVPKDTWGYFTGWFTLVSFGRDGGPTPRPGNDEWAGYPGLTDHFSRVWGVRKDNVRYLGNQAMTVNDEEPRKRTKIWQQDTPGRWTDVDSVLSQRHRKPIFFRYDPDAATVVYAGGVLYHTAFVMGGDKGTDSTIYARNPADGKLLWSADVAERANQLIVANGRLFASTRQGTIYCFAPKGTKTLGVIDEPIIADAGTGVVAGDDAPVLATAAETIVKETGVTAGYAVVLDSDSGGLALELAKQTKLYVIAIFSDADKAAAARKIYARTGLHVSRIIAYHQAPGTKLPFASFFATLVVSESAATGGALPQDAEDLGRILQPIRGVAIIGGKQSEAALTKWTAATKQSDWAIVKGNGVWAKRVGPRLKEAGGWFGKHADAGRTNCSQDGVLKPPLGVVWYGAPHFDYGGRTPGAWVTDGVILIPQRGWLIAYDAYTGRELWRLNVRTDMTCAPGSIFLRYFEKIDRLDPSTGKIIQQYLPPLGGKWDKMDASRDGKTLYLAAGGDQDGKGWSCILAVDVASGKVQWNLGGPGQKKQWGNWNLIGDGYIYLSGGSGANLKEKVIAEIQAYLKATDPERLARYNRELKSHTFSSFTTIDAKTGKVLYSHGVDTTNAGGKWLPGVNYGSGRNARHYNPVVFPLTMAHKDVIIFCTESGADKGWRVWPSGQYGHRSIAVHDGRTGKLLWKRQANYRGRPVVVDNTIYAEPWGYDIHTGERKQRIHPITGKQTDWAFCRHGKQCGIVSASKYFLFGRSLGVGYHDLFTDQGLYTFYHSRMSCTYDAVSGGGVMVKPPMATYCKCAWSLPFTVAMGQVPTQPSVGQVFAQPGPTLPVKHLYLDFAATGDRRDKAGNLWVHPNRPHKHALLMGHKVTVEMYPGGKDVRRNSQHTHIENTDTPFVFATAARGLKRCIIPVTTPTDGAGTFKVRLAFAALPGDKPGQRVFDVKLNGKTVLANFDIAKETGKPDRAVWKEFTLKLDGDLVLDLAAKTDKPTLDQMPLINGLQILR